MTEEKHTLHSSRKLIVEKLLDLERYLETLGPADAWVDHGSNDDFRVGFSWSFSGGRKRLTYCVSPDDISMESKTIEQMKPYIRRDLLILSCQMRDAVMKANSNDMHDNISLASSFEFMLKSWESSDEKIKVLSVKEV